MLDNPHFGTDLDVLAGFVIYQFGRININSVCTMV